MEVKFLKIDTQSPLRLYKYFSNIDYVKDCIVNKQIHLEKILSYNDIFDGSGAITSEFIKSLSNSDNSCYKMICKSLKKTNYSWIVDELNRNGYTEICNKLDYFGDVADTIHSFLKNIKGDTCPKKDNIIDIVKKSCFGNAQREQPDNISCSCFSEVNDSLLMWGYYTNCHKGVCIEFDLSSKIAKTDEIVSNIRKINYTNCNNDIWCDKSSFYKKSLEWHHEQEWRIIADMDNEEYLPFPYVSAIYLGVRTPQKDKDELIKLAKQYSLKVYQLIPNAEKYQLDIEIIENNK